MEGSIQFGLCTVKMDGETLANLQNINFDFSFSVAELLAGNGLYAIDVRTHSGSIKGKAEAGIVNALFFSKILGGTPVGSQIVYDNLDKPSTFELICELITDGVTFKLTFPKARATKTSFAFDRTKHVIPSFDFQIEANAVSGSVATIDFGDTGSSATIDFGDES
jgi:hypothetical protein